MQSSEDSRLLRSFFVKESHKTGTNIGFHLFRHLILPLIFLCVFCACSFFFPLGTFEFNTVFFIKRHFYVNILFFFPVKWESLFDCKKGIFVLKLLSFLMCKLIMNTHMPNMFWSSLFFFFFEKKNSF